MRFFDFKNRNHVYMGLVVTFFIGTVAFVVVFLRTTLDYIAGTQEGLSQLEYTASEERSTQ